MKKTILIAGCETLAGSAIAQEALRLGYSVLGSCSRDAMPPAEAQEGSVRLVPWNRASGVSARNLVLEASNAFGDFDEAVIAFAPASLSGGLASLPVSSIEECCDSWIKGNLLVYRELMGYFLKRRKGSIALLLEESESINPLGRSASGAFEAFAQSAIVSDSQGLIRVFGYSFAPGAHEALAAQVLKAFSEEDKRGASRWQRFTGRSGFFGRA